MHANKARVIGIMLVKGCDAYVSQREVRGEGRGGSASAPAVLRLEAADQCGKSRKTRGLFARTDGQNTR